ncbi:MAG: hypothetical protein HY858_05245 [Candidatus Solibacter usitatus]|nr:hypothetical protein [Candidatus Solibacter usitatus]
MSESDESGQWRMSAILTVTRDGTESFETLDQMPQVLRARCVKALQGDESATLVIADQEGRAFVQRQLERRAGGGSETPAPGPASSYPWRLALEIALVGCAGLALWLLATLR